MDSIQLQNCPLNVDTTCYRLDLTDADASLALPVGGYFVNLVSSETKGCTLRLGTAAVAPTHAGGSAHGGTLPPGAVATLEVRTAASLHAIMNATSTTGVLYLTKAR